MSRECDEAPERIRLVKREGVFDGRWYYPDAAIAPFDAEIEYVRASVAATPPTSPSDAAMRAAEEVSSTFELKFQHDSLHRVAAIITRHLAASSDAVAAVEQMLADTQAAKKTLAQEATSKTFEDATLNVWTLRVIIDRLKSLSANVAATTSPNVVLNSTNQGGGS